MALTTETVDLAAEAERLREQMHDVAEEHLEWRETVANAEEGSQSYRSARERQRELARKGDMLNNQANILDWAREEWDIESVKLAGLTTGEVNRVEDTVQDHNGVRERDAWVAIGTHEAPYLEHDPEDVVQEDYEVTVMNVADLPLPWNRWAEGKISELSHLSEATGNGYMQLLREKQAEP